MKISVFGLGYVGIVTAGCLCRAKHDVIGVDISEFKVDQMNRGESPIIEEGIAELIATSRQSGRLRATTSTSDAIEESDMAIICVGTPSERNGSLSTRYVEAIVTEIGALLKGRTTPLLIVVRSTMLPGTMNGLVVPLLTESSESEPGTSFEVVFHPEFLREGSSIKDFYDPPKIVVGERIPGAADKLVELYADFTAPLFRVSYEAAEMVKYCDNMFHALKITFANEVGQFCRSLEIDSHEVMEIFCSDTKLNLSPRYLRPGFAFGGSCLPKDLRAFLYAARSREVETPMLAGILPSNRRQIEDVAEAIIDTGHRLVGFWGLAFKPGTDDLRESPLVMLAEILLGKGIELRIHDSSVLYARLIGRNKAYVEQVLPHLSRLLVESADSLDQCPLIVLGHHASAERTSRWYESGKVLYDLDKMKIMELSPALNG